MRPQWIAESPLLSLAALGGLIALAVRLGAAREWGLPAMVLASAALVALVILTSGVRSTLRLLEESRRTRRQRLPDIDGMDGLEFERYLREILEHRGFQAALTPSSDDRGVDIVAERDEFCCAIQVKRHHGLVSRRAVSDAVAGMKHYGCNAAMVVTNSYFTASAVALAESNDCELVDRDLLAGWIGEFQRRESGV
jgi:HJR/Mrr/RecB family endonuclease